jgi:hypothetical protein
VLGVCRFVRDHEATAYSGVGDGRKDLQGDVRRRCYIANVAHLGNHDLGRPHEAVQGQLVNCRRCGALIAIFPDHSLHWQHFRGDGTTSGTQETYEPGHAAEVTWILPDEDSNDLE